MCVLSSIREGLRGVGCWWCIREAGGKGLGKGHQFVVVVVVGSSSSREYLVDKAGAASLSGAAAVAQGETEAGGGGLGRARVARRGRRPGETAARRGAERPKQRGVEVQGKTEDTAGLRGKGGTAKGDRETPRRAAAAAPPAGGAAECQEGGEWACLVAAKGRAEPPLVVCSGNRGRGPRRAAGL